MVTTQTRDGKWPEEIKVAYCYLAKSRQYFARAHVLRAEGHPDAEVAHTHTCAHGDTPQEAMGCAIQYVRRAYALGDLAQPETVKRCGKLARAVLDLQKFR